MGSVVQQSMIPAPMRRACGSLQMGCCPASVSAGAGSQMQMLFWQDYREATRSSYSMRPARQASRATMSAAQAAPHGVVALRRWKGKHAMAVGGDNQHHLLPMPCAENRAQPGCAVVGRQVLFVTPVRIRVGCTPKRDPGNKAEAIALGWVLCKQVRQAIEFAWVQFDPHFQQNLEVSGVASQPCQLSGRGVRAFVPEIYRQRDASYGHGKTVSDIDYIQPRSGATTAARWGQPEVDVQAEAPPEEAVVMNANHNLLGWRLAMWSTARRRAGRHGRRDRSHPAQSAGKALVPADVLQRQDGYAYGEA
jgi:hypothetical protein